MLALTFIPVLLSAFLGSVFTVGILWYLGYVRFDAPKRSLTGAGIVERKDAAAPSESTDKDKKS